MKLKIEEILSISNFMQFNLAFEHVNFYYSYQIVNKFPFNWICKLILQQSKRHGIRPEQLNVHGKTILNFSKSSKFQNLFVYPVPVSFYIYLP